MEIDNPGESNRDITGVQENGLHLFPVSVNDSGEGFPYAPVDWPNPGDKWKWKVGRRIGVSGYFIDRYLYPPSRFHRSARKRSGLASKLSVQEFILAISPDADVDAFFASFSWKIPSKEVGGLIGGEEELKVVTFPSEEIVEHSGIDSKFEGVGCKAGNNLCSSLLESHTSSLEAMGCDICCSEPGFCRDCCCILCSKTISSAYGGYSFIRCEAMMGEGTICGHIAHIDCAVRCYMAGTVGGTIGLDAEYYCRRCDSTTNLVSHVTKLLRTCESIESPEDIEKILNVGSCVLRGSQKTSAKNLLRRIELAMAKLKDGACLVDIWKTEDISSVTAGGWLDHVNDTMEATNYQEPLAFGAGSPQVLSGNFDLRMESLKLEDEIDQILQALRKAQNSEYRIAEETLHAQKNYILDLYQQLNHERLELSAKTPPNNSESLLEAVLNREDEIKREIKKLRDMEEVAKGFGKTSKDILKEHFGLKMDR